MFEGLLVLESLLFVNDWSYQSLSQTVVSVYIEGLVLLVLWVWLEQDHLTFNLREWVSDQDVILIELLNLVVFLDF